MSFFFIKNTTLNIKGIQICHTLSSNMWKINNMLLEIMVVNALIWNKPREARCYCVMHMLKTGFCGMIKHSYITKVHEYMEHKSCVYEKNLKKKYTFYLVEEN